MAAPPHVLRDYALLADGERGALIDPRGQIAWLCFPGWADPAVLAGLLGGEGTYAITPRGPFVWGGHYEPGSLIWRSRWVTGDAVVECREALAFPGDPDMATILRRVEVLGGHATLDVTCALAADYGRRPAGEPRRDGGVWRASAGAHETSWRGASAARPRQDGTLHLTLALDAGGHHDFVLALGHDAGAIDPEIAWAETEAAWATAAPELPVSLARRDARHARAVMRGLTSSGGGMVAAATMSLPERARAGRAYDYRYAWIRDQAFAGQAAARAGADDLLDGAAAFLTARLLEHGPKLAPAYTVFGGPVAAEHSVGLPGYPGGSDLAGNHAGAQFQLDAFGETLLCLAAADERDRLEADHWRAAQAAAEAIAARHDEPDAGIWELEPDRWTHSRLICAAGLRAISTRPAARAHAGTWLALADALVAAAAAAVSPAGAWQRSPTDPRVDAALLFAAIRGATPPADARALATVAAVEAELADEFFAYRFRPDARPLGDAEGAFLLCGFGMALALHAVGREVEAAHWFERNRSACGPPGLLSEEFDIAQRQLRGNLPQAFVHALLLECAATLPGHEIDDETKERS